MQKEYSNVLLAGFDQAQQDNLITLLEEFQKLDSDINLRCQPATEYLDVINAVSENIYKICLLNKSLLNITNNKILEEIQNILIVQNKYTAIIIIDTSPPEFNTTNPHLCPDAIQINNGINYSCVTQVNLHNLNHYWMKFIVKSAIEKSQLQKEIKRLSHYDNLTGLVNRNLYLTHLNHALALAEREKKFCSLIYLDINNFKNFNNKLGYKIGDQILIECAQRIKKTIRSVDIAARLGSDEFAILLENCDPKEANRIIIDLNTAMEMPYNICNEKIYIECSIDYASYPDSNSDKISFLNNVRQAHYLAKTS